MATSKTTKEMTATEIKNAIKTKLFKDFEQIIFQEYGNNAGRTKASNTNTKSK